MSWLQYLYPSAVLPIPGVTDAAKAAYQSGASTVVDYLSPDAAAAIRKEEQRKLRQEFWSKNGASLGVLALVLVLVWLKRGRERRGT